MATGEVTRHPDYGRDDQELRSTKMGGRRSGTSIRASVFAGALAVAQAASAGEIILNHDEWTLTDYGFAQAPASTTAFAQNLAAQLNSNGGPCNLLVYSDNFGLT